MKRASIVPSLLLALLAVAAGAAAAATAPAGQLFDRLGNPRYTGPADLKVASSLFAAGGGAGGFVAHRALVALIGRTAAEAEIARLDREYGPAAVGSALRIASYTFNDAAAIAREEGMTLPTPQISGATLARDVIADGTVHGTFWTGYLLDHLFSHQVDKAVMTDVDMRFDSYGAVEFHQVVDQMLFDVARTVGASNVSLSPEH